jgi:hypothetical protein
MLLASPAGRAELGRWPQYARGAIVTDAQGRCHVKLGVFQFFIFWFAFYVIRGDGGGGDAQGGAYRPQTAGLTQSVRKVRAPPPPHIPKLEAKQCPNCAGMRKFARRAYDGSTWSQHGPWLRWPSLP